MPTISVNKSDLDRLLDRTLSLDEIEALLPRVKGELKGVEGAGEVLRIELADTNRPDLWCVEGIARQFGAALGGSVRAYAFGRRPSGGRTRYRLLVDAALREVRPYIGACVAKGLAITGPLLDQIIQTQEKLSELYGRRRQAVSIGFYRLQKLSFPVYYRLAPAREIRFVPLGFDLPMSGAEILEKHPKGIEYGHLLGRRDHLPVLVDSAGQTLSLPPVINSRLVGEVVPGDRELLVEATGSDLRMVALVINILAANLADWGADIFPVRIEYAYPTPFGKTLRTPLDMSRWFEIRPEALEKTLGERIPAKELEALLRAFGYEVRAKGKTLSVRAPLYRDDLLHVVDVVEDIAIAHGYDRFEPAPLSFYTVGALSEMERLSDRVRELMVGFGFQEVISNILTSREDLLDRMQQQDELAAVENAFSQNYAVLRQSIIPSLLRVEAASSKSFYPHRIFEVGEVVRLEKKSNLGCQTRVELGGLIAHAAASFSEIHAFLEMLFYYLALDYRLEPSDHPSLIPGRSGRILVHGTPRGWVGEIQPQVLDRWGIRMPCAVFELTLDGLPG